MLPNQMKHRQMKNGGVQAAIVYLFTSVECKGELTKALNLLWMQSIINHSEHRVTFISL